MNPIKTSALALVALFALTGCSSDSTAPAANAQLRVVHASPNAPNVDVLVDGTVALTNVPFPAASDYLAVAAGTRSLQVRATGTSTVVINENANLTTGNAYTVLATGPVASIAPLVLQDDRSAPAAGNVRVRLVHASPTAGSVDIYVTAPGADIATATPTLSAVPFRGASDYLEVPAGTYRVRVTPANSKTVALDVNNVSLSAGQVRTAIAIDAPGGGLPVGAILLADWN